MHLAINPIENWLFLLHKFEDNLYHIIAVTFSHPSDKGTDEKLQQNYENSRTQFLTFLQFLSFKHVFLMPSFINPSLLFKYLMFFLHNLQRKSKFFSSTNVLMKTFQDFKNSKEEK